MDICAFRTPLTSKPGSIARTLTNVRINSPAPTSSSVQSATSLTTSDARNSPDRRPVVVLAPSSGTVTVGSESWSVTRGDLFVVPSWQPLSIRSEASASDSDSGALDLFRFSDTPIFEKLNLYRSQEDSR